VDHLRFLVDTATFKRGANGNVTGEIALKVGATPFPAEDWSDFPVIVAGWWMEELRSLRLDGGECELSFMDGPFSVKVSGSNSGSVSIDLYKNEAAVSFHPTIVPRADFLNAALEAAEKIESFCRAKGWNSADLALLRENIGSLRRSTE